MAIKVGDTIPSGEFAYVPYEPALDDIVRLLDFHSSFVLTAHCRWCAAHASPPLTVY